MRQSGVPDRWPRRHRGDRRIPVGAAKRDIRATRASQRMRRRRRKIALVAAGMLLIPAVASGEPSSRDVPDLSAMNDVGRGLMGLTDPDSVSADGALSENDQIGVDVLRDAGNPD